MSLLVVRAFEIASNTRKVDGHRYANNSTGYAVKSFFPTIANNVYVSALFCFPLNNCIVLVMFTFQCI